LKDFLNEHRGIIMCRRVYIKGKFCQVNLFTVNLFTAALNEMETEV
jgi:hypothetical protein